MAQTNLQLPQVVIPNTTLGIDWLNPNNILLADSQYAVSAGTTQVLTVGNFPINLLQDDTVTNIIFSVKGYRGSFNTTLQIFAIDDTTGVELSYPLLPSFQGFDGVNTVWTLPATLFGTNWSINEINNIKIRLIADGELHLDFVGLNVIYTPASVLPVPVDPDDGEVVCSEFVQAQPFQLALSMTSSDLFCFVTSFNYPDGSPIAFADFHGDDAFLVIDQGIPIKEETVRITAVDQNFNGGDFCRLSFGTVNNRGLAFKWPYTTDPNLRQDHTSTAELVISNPAAFYDRFLKKCQIGALVSAPIRVSKDDVSVVYPATNFNFHGSVVVSQDATDSEEADIYITAGGGTTPPQIANTTTCTAGNVQVASITCSIESVGQNRLLLVQVSTEEAQTITGITYDGVALIQETTVTDVGANIRSEIWSLVAPNLGVHDIVISLSGLAYISMGAEIIVGVDAVTPIGTTQTASGNDNNPILSLITTYDNSIVIDALSTALTPILYTPGAGQTANWSRTANTDTRQGGSSVEQAGLQPDTITMDYAITQTTDWVYGAVEVKGITTASATGQVGILWEDEGVPLGTPGTVDEVDFVGSPVIATRVGNKVTVTVVAASGTELIFSVNQVAHGLSAGDVIKSNGVDDEFAQAQADSPINSEAVGIVTNVIDADNFEYVSSAVQLSGGFVPVGTPGSGVFLDPTVPGGMTITKPTAIGQIVRGLGTIIASGATMYFDISALAEEITISSGLSGGGTKIAVDTTEITISNDGTLTSLFTPIPIPGGTLGTNNAIRFEIYFSDLSKNALNGNLDFNLLYGGATVATITINEGVSGAIVTKGVLKGWIVADGLTNAQKVSMTLYATDSTSGDEIEVTGDTAVRIGKMLGMDDGVGAIDSTIDQNLEMTAQFSGGLSVASSLTAEWIIVEKITGPGSSDAKKKVGVGEESNIQWYNTQLLFMTGVDDAGVAQAKWVFGGTGVNPPLGFSFITLDDTDEATIELTNWAFDTATALELFTDAGKQIIIEGQVRWEAATDDRTGWGLGPGIDGSINENSEHIGIGSYNDGTFYASNGNGVAKTTTALASLSNGTHTLRIEDDQGNATPQIRFYVDGVLVATHTTNLPTMEADFSAGNSGPMTGGISLVSAPSGSFEL